MSSSFSIASPAATAMCLLLLSRPVGCFCCCELFSFLLVRYRGLIACPRCLFVASDSLRRPGWPKIVQHSRQCPQAGRGGAPLLPSAACRLDYFSMGATPPPCGHAIIAPPTTGP